MNNLSDAPIVPELTITANMVLGNYEISEKDLLALFHSKKLFIPIRGSEEKAQIQILTIKHGDAPIVPNSF